VGTVVLSAIWLRYLATKESSRKSRFKTVVCKIYTILLEKKIKKRVKKSLDKFLGGAIL
jgi:hypothetical protein